MLSKSTYSLQAYYLFSDDLSSAFVFFFFSSRRPHTICYRDWSSDVCSSDLHGRRRSTYSRAVLLDSWSASDPDSWRSEERRVGKEGRSRWSPHHYKKKKKRWRSHRRDRGPGRNPPWEGGHARDE